MKTVAVLRGGPSSEHAVSLKTGASVIKALEERARPLDVFIDTRGVWHVRGIPVSPERALSSVDVVFNALHGEYGEDGTVQRILDRLGVSYTGSGALSSALAMNKILTKDVVRRAGIRVPNAVILTVSSDFENEMVRVFRSFPQPSVVKPSTAGSSIGVTLARNFNEFRRGVKEAFAHSKEVIVEEYVRGREATAGVIEQWRGKEIYTLPPVEIIPKSSCVFFDYEAKYSGESEERCPGNFSMHESEELQRLAALAHEALGLRHYSRSDFIVTPKGIYFLETNTLPGLTEQSLLPKSLSAVGVPIADFLEHTINLAQGRR